MPLARYRRQSKHRPSSWLHRLFSDRSCEYDGRRRPAVIRCSCLGGGRAEVIGNRQRSEIFGCTDYGPSRCEFFEPPRRLLSISILAALQNRARLNHGQRLAWVTQDGRLLELAGFALFILWDSPSDCLRKRLLFAFLLILGSGCLPGCAQFQKTANNARQKQWNGVQFGSATYNQWTHDFEEPWPWGSTL